MRSFALVLGCLLGPLAWPQTPEKDLRSLLQEGDDALLQSKWQNAEASFEKAVVKDPSSVEAHSKLSNAVALQLHPGPVTSPENRVPFSWRRTILVFTLNSQTWNSLQ